MPTPRDLGEMTRGLQSWEAYAFEPMGPTLSEPESATDGQA